MLWSSQNKSPPAVLIASTIISAAAIRTKTRFRQLVKLFETVVWLDSILGFSCKCVSPCFFYFWIGLMNPVRETFGTAIYFIAYESMKQAIVKYQGLESPTSPIAVALAGGCCGILSLVSVSQFYHFRN